MSTYKFEYLDSGLALIDAADPDNMEWVDVEWAELHAENEIVVRVVLCDSNDSNLFTFDVEGAEDIRKGMSEWLERNGYSVSIPSSSFAAAKRVASLTEAEALTARFREGDYTPFAAAA